MPTSASLSLDQIERFNNFGSFPATGDPDVLYIDDSSGDLYTWDGAAYVLISAGLNVQFYADFASFPGTGSVDILYIDKALKVSYVWDGAAYVRIDEEAAGQDEVQSFVNFAAFPGTGETGVIYIDEFENKTYRWDGAAYVEISTDTTSVDVESHATLAAFPVTGRTGVIYIDESDGKTYRWNGSSYVEISTDTVSIDVEQHATTGAFPTTGELHVIYIDQSTDQLYRWDGAAYQLLSETPDEILYFNDFASFPVTGEVNTTYVDKALAESYIWDGAAYIRLDDETLSGFCSVLSGGNVTENVPTDSTVLVAAVTYNIDGTEYTITPGVTLDMDALHGASLNNGDKAFVAIYVDTDGTFKTFLGQVVPNQSNAQFANPPAGSCCLAQVEIHKNSGTIQAIENKRIFDCRNEAPIILDEQVKVSFNDTITKYLEDAFDQGGNVTFTIINEGGNEKIQFNASGTATFHDRQIVSSHSVDSTSSGTYADIAGLSITTGNLGGTGTYNIRFNADVTTTQRGNENHFFVIAVDGVPIADSERLFTLGRDAENDLHNFSLDTQISGIAAGSIITVQFRQASGGTLTVASRSLMVDGILDTNVI